MEMAKLMKINGQIQRMDSLMIASNIKKLSRMELLYTCLSNFVKYLHKNKEDDKIEGLARTGYSHEGLIFQSVCDSLRQLFHRLRLVPHHLKF